MAAESDLILVAGATGKQGGAVVQRLRAAGYALRALTRDPQSERARRLHGEGVELVRGDLTDRASLDEALAGVTRVFAMATPFNEGGGLDDEVAQGKTLGEAAKAAGVSHYVYSSAGAAERGTGIPHFESKWLIEQHLRALDLPLTVFRPAWFFENLGMYALQPQGDGYIVPMPLSPERTLQGVAVRDLAAFVALAFADPQAWRGRALELAGDELTGPQYARAVAARIGKPVSYVQIPWEAVRGRSEDLYRMYDYFERVGFQADIPALRALDPQLHSFEGWLADGGLRVAAGQAA
jgi:uncharacterized protein YbjT (DUF2867 family)